MGHVNCLYDPQIPSYLSVEKVNATDALTRSLRAGGRWLQLLCCVILTRASWWRVWQKIQR